MTRVLLLLISIVSFFSAFSQDVNLNLGTEFPLQYYFGANYQHGKWVSGDLSFGIITAPYNNELYNWIEVPKDKKAEKKFLQESTDGGSVIDLGLNLHYRKWYCGIFGQRIHLNASDSYNNILNSDLVQDELEPSEKEVIDQFLNSPLALFVNLEDEVQFKTDLFQAGFKVGRRFDLKDPQWSLFVEMGITKNISSNSTSNYNRELIQSIINLEEQVNGGNDSELDEKLDLDGRIDEIDSFFNDYGNIPNFSLGISYHINYKKNEELNKKE